MNRLELARIACKRLDIRINPEGQGLIEMAFRVMAETLERGEKVTIRGIGKFHVRLHPGYANGYDPVRRVRTGVVPPYRRLYFLPSRDLQLYLRGQREIPHRSVRQIRDLWIIQAARPVPAKRRKRRTVEEMAG